MLPAGGAFGEAAHIHRGNQRDTSGRISLKKRNKRLLPPFWARDSLRVCDEKRSATRKVTAYCFHKRLLLLNLHALKSAWVKYCSLSKVEPYVNCF